MNQEEKYIARIVFKNRLLSSNGQAYQDLFVNVMVSANSDFEPVKPHGQQGDQKNDGFNKKTGQYYQVYAPETLAAKEKATLEKLESTISGLFSFWQPISPIKEFYYVINDRYAGVYPSIHQELALIQKNHKIVTGTFLCKDIEEVFLNLSDEKIIEIIGGFLPSPSNIQDIDISILSEIISYLLNFSPKPIDENFPENPDFERKIEFNKLSKSYGRLLNAAFYQDYIINEYFSLNSQFTKHDLKLVFSDFYNQGQLKHSEIIENKPDLIFQFIWEKSCPTNNNAVKNAVLVLMSHYFESCDIFEEPKEPKQKSLF
jgi:hypothetical protein